MHELVKQLRELDNHDVGERPWAATELAEQAADLIEKQAAELEALCLSSGGQGWQDIATARVGPRPFLALNHDGEIWLTRREIDHNQKPVFVFRANSLRQPRSYRIHEIDGKRLLEELDGRERDEWQSAWTYWTNGYDFRPTHWMPLPEPPSVGISRSEMNPKPSNHPQQQGEKP